VNLKNSFLHPIFNGILFLLILWMAGLLLFARDVQNADNTISTTLLHADGIVVLTGGSERIPAGLNLLHNKVAPRLLISGVDPDVEPSIIIANHPAKAQLNCCITLGTLAQDTRGNAAEAAAWVKKFNIKSLIVVTANYHIRRSVLEFHQTMPDIPLTPFAVNPASAHVEKWWAHAGTASLLMEEYNKLLAAYIKAAVKRVMRVE
jgi:uncharacterized SAM-binding protein YcdF (DUF218 family)